MRTSSADSGGIVLVSLCYMVLGRLLQLAVLRVRSDDVKGAGNRGAAARDRGSPTTDRSAGVDVDRPSVSDRGEPAVAAQPLAIVHRHARDTAALASALGGEALDVRTAS